MPCFWEVQTKTTPRPQNEDNDPSGAPAGASVARSVLCRASHSLSRADCAKSSRATASFSMASPGATKEAKNKQHFCFTKKSW